MAQPWLFPAATAVAPVVNPVGAIGDAALTCVPSPSWLALLPPQHRIPPPTVRAHECVPPPATRLSPVSPATSEGTDRWATVVSPTCPLLFRPQQASPPPTRTQLCEPLAIARVAPATPRTSTGTRRGVVTVP